MIFAAIVFSALALTSWTPAWNDPSAVELPADYTDANRSRVDWDIPLACDLSAEPAGVSFDFKIDDPTAFSALTCYFNSGEGCYSAPFYVHEPGVWKHIVVYRGMLRGKTYGSPTGWGKISSLRITGWRMGRISTKCAIRKLSLATPEEIALAKRGVVNDDAVREYVARQPSKGNERRLIWCHSPYGLDKKAGWDDSIRVVREGGFSDIIANLSWAGTSFYRSDVLPTHESVLTKGDQLNLCLAACRKFGVKCHVWHVCWRLGHGCAKALSGKMLSEGRLQVKSEGSLDDAWLCPSDPRNRRQEVEAFVELANKGVDGIHLDYVRYPGMEVCFCRGCRKRFEEKVGKRYDEWPQVVLRQGEAQKAWLRFRADNITSFVRDVCVSVRKVNPTVEISAAVFSDSKACFDRVGQDWPLWCRENWLDFVCPMSYYPTLPAFELAIRGYAPLMRSAGTAVYPGIGLCSSASRIDARMMSDQILSLRAIGYSGFTVFQLDGYAREVLPILRTGPTSID